MKKEKRERQVAEWGRCCKKGWREIRKGGEARTREEVLLMISPPAVGLGWSKRRERREVGWKGGTVAEETKWALKSC